MKVRVAKSAGFCMGVRKAMDTVLDVSRMSKETYTYGPLVHNPQALDMLEKRNIYAVTETEGNLSGKTIVIRAHGIPPDVQNRLNEMCLRVVDATCPKVMRSQKIIAKYFSENYTIVIVGDRGHAEIDGLLGYTNGTGIVVETLDEAKSLPKFQKICVIAQTTLDIDKYEAISGEICSHADECYIARTICSSTERRQADIRKLAEVTDATVVVGGKNSANTNRLAKISMELGQPTFLIEDSSDLDLKELSKYNEIGITAGASTPTWVIQEVVDLISAYTPETEASFIGYLKKIAFLAVEGNFFASLSASALTFAMCLVMSIPPKAIFLLMSFFYLFPMHTFNKYLEINWKYVSTKSGANFIKKYWGVFLAFSVFSSIISLFLALNSDILTFVLVLLTYILAGIYSIKVIPSGWNVRFKSLRDIPGSKDIMVATAWTFAVVFLPAFTHEQFPGAISIVAAAYVFVLVFSKVTILAIGGMQADRLVGQETIPVLIGRRKTEKLLYSLNSLLGAGVILLVVTGTLSISALTLLIPVGYMSAYTWYLSRKNIIFRLYHQILIDIDFFLAGILAYIFIK